MQKIIRLIKALLLEPHKVIDRILYKLGLGNEVSSRTLYDVLFLQIAPERFIWQNNTVSKTSSQSKAHQDLCFSKGLQVALYDQRLMDRQPLFLLPQGKKELCQSLAIAISRADITREDAQWFLSELYKSPCRELYRTWFFTPTWQKSHPLAPTIFGYADFLAWLKSEFKIENNSLNVDDHSNLLPPNQQIRLAYAHQPRWQKAFPLAFENQTQASALINFLKADATLNNEVHTYWQSIDKIQLVGELLQNGVNVLGHFSYPSGLRTSTEAVVMGLNEVGFESSQRNVRVSLRKNDPVHHLFDGLELFDTTIIHVQPEPFFGETYALSGLAERLPRTRRIAYWYWEFDSVPDSWRRCADNVDEIWTANEFIAKGLREKFKQPVHAFMPGLTLPEFKQQPRSHFDLDDDVFIFTFVFHMSSVMERKNPQALIAAFNRAFSEADNVMLVIKTSFGEQHPTQLKELQSAANKRIKIIDEVWSQTDTLGLIGCTDVYISLHRSEGLGLTMAEAMLMAKPVIGTRYSGNLEFMNDRNSLLVDYDLIELDKEYPPYKKGMSWANPSVTHAAQLMRQLYDNPEQAKALGLFAQQDLLNRFNHAAVGQRMKMRLDEIKKRAH